MFICRFFIRFLISILYLLVCLPAWTKEEYISLIRSPHDDYCITNSSSAMYHTTITGKVQTNATSILPPYSFRCNFEEKEENNCIQYFKKGAWSRAYSVKTPILDVRWEEFPIKTPSSAEKHEISYVLLLELTREKNFEVAMSLIGQQASLLLCDKPNFDNARCYWIMLQARKKNSVVMKKCTEVKGNNLENFCSGVIGGTNYPNDLHLYLNEGTWSNLIIERMDSNIYLKLYHKGTTILHYVESDEDMFELNYLLGGSINNETSYKMHENYFMQSKTVSEETFTYRVSRRDNGFCISIFLKTCPICLTSVQFISETWEKFFEYHINSTNGIWKEHKIVMNISYNAIMAVQIKTLLKEGHHLDGNEYWAFDNIRECRKKEYRVTKISSPTVSQCRLLVNDEIVEMGNVTDDISVYRRSSSFSIESSYNACNDFELIGIPCDTLQICEIRDGSNTCYCSPGSRGQQCDEVCPKGTYGYSCQERCGFCSREGECNPKDGSCTCNAFFEGATCHMPREDQYLINAPKVIESGADFCKIKWNNEEFRGRTKPEYYVIQISDEKSTSWTNYGGVRRINDGTGLVRDLSPNKKYKIRVLISYSNVAILKLQSVDLPYSICTTKCKEWKPDDIHILSTTWRARIYLNLPKQRCSSVTYIQWKLKNEQGQEIQNGKEAADFDVSKLDAFTNYTIEFIFGSQTSSRYFRTAEGVPSDIRDMKLENSTAYSMKISWKEPEYPNGEIIKYKVQYQKLKRISCDVKASSTVELESTINSIDLNNLEPYYVYLVKVFAANKLQSNKGVEEKFETKGLNYFNYSKEDLGLIKITNETSQDSSSIIFHNINCQKLLGPLDFPLSYRCASKWCLDKETHTYILHKEQPSHRLNKLQPYCEYALNISICRGETCIPYNNGTFSTKVSVPNVLREFSIISAGANFISIRWLPPYPPTGVLKPLQITTRCTNCFPAFVHTNTFRLNPKKCDIWNEYYCLQIEKYIHHGKKASIQIKAANEESETYVQVAFKDNILVEESKPDEPNNCSIVLDLENHIEIFWNHPNRTNGILKYFTIQVNNLRHTYSYPVEQQEYKLIYKYKINQPLPPAIDFNVRIIAYNNKYPSQAVEIKESSYPAKPELIHPQILVTNFTKSSISITLNVTQVNVNYDDNVDQYLIILIDDQSLNAEDQNLILMENILNFKFNETARQRIVAALDLNEQPKKTIDFTIGDGNEMKENNILKVKIFNKPLQEVRYFNITVIMLNGYNRKYRFNSYTFRESNGGTTLPSNTEGEKHIPPQKKEGKKENDASNGRPAYALLLLLLLIPIIIWLLTKRKNGINVRAMISFRKILDTSLAHSSPSTEIDEITLLDTEETEVRFQMPEMEVSPKSTVSISSSSQMVCTSNMHANDSYSRPIRVADFEDYLKTSLDGNELERQHALFPRGQTQPWLYGSTIVNRHKNRYNNLVAYDHSRVILEKIDGDESSDYINANYIHGFDIERAYIATQGPKSTTLSDFWRMIWQENVRHIVMMANIYEGGKKKVDQYWPNINEELTFHNIVVHYQSTILFTSFELRVFNVKKGDEKRQVKQLHFTSWPDHGVPLYPQSLVAFLGELVKIPLSSASPIVVHCSAGVGRTGTIILSDMSLRRAAKHEVVNMLNDLHNLRAQRPNMVDNAVQYRLAHLVVFEFLMGLRTSIPCDEHMDEAVQKLIEDEEYKIQLNYLKKTEWQDKAMNIVAEIMDDPHNHPEKNRIQEIIPGNVGRILLRRYPKEDESSSYINAVRVDGFRCPDRFLITQQPMPNTLGDFWRLVAEREISVIISLNEVNLEDNMSCKFWPTASDPELQAVDFLLVKFGSVTELENFDKYSLHVWIQTEHEKKKIDVVIVSFKQWPAKSIIPVSSKEFLSFYGSAEAISRKSSNVIVTCFDGVTASGVFVALSFMIGQMELEKELDICLALRTIRHNRKQFINNEDQLLFLYECAVKFVRGFLLNGTKISDEKDAEKEFQE